ncbi:MAG: hypothetical protein JXB14_00065 [Candidatus Altiarchaeota archaeon]|nr:hypothetical protein [Candidatus Altiarchaeota archaeon]
MKKSRFGQVNAEYLLIVIVGIAVVVGAYSFLNPTVERTASWGEEELEELKELIEDGGKSKDGESGRPFAELAGFPPYCWFVLECGKYGCGGEFLKLLDPDGENEDLQKLHDCCGCEGPAVGCGQYGTYPKFVYPFKETDLDAYCEAVKNDKDGAISIERCSC